MQQQEMGLFDFSEFLAAHKPAEITLNSMKSPDYYALEPFVLQVKFSEVLVFWADQIVHLKGESAMLTLQLVRKILVRTNQNGEMTGFIVTCLDDRTETGQRRVSFQTREATS